MRALLDVNVLVALFDPDHVHHAAAHAWLEVNGPLGIATCPLTENGLARVLSSPAYGDPPLRSADIMERLESFRVSADHEFWPDAVSLRDRSLFRLRAIGHRQLTDVYLLGLARSHGARLATFDRSIPLGAVVGAREEHRALLAA